jgi:IS30 family transposase
MNLFSLISMARSNSKCNIFLGKCCMKKNYTHLTLEERTMIQTQLSMGFKPAQIARELGRSASTLSRELKRNGWARPSVRRSPGRPLVAVGYRAGVAHQRASVLQATPRTARRLHPQSTLWPPVMAYLKEGYSPEQIAGTLATVHPHQPSLRVSHETIYTAIYAMPRGEMRTEVIGWLRFAHAKRRPRARGEDRRGRIPDMVSIHDRPPEIDERWVPGHWEGDFIKGAYNRSSVGTLVERTTLFTVLAKMDDATAASAVKGFSQVLNRIEAQKRLSMTYDQGREMAAHAQLTEATGIKVYFADPHSPWQRGINENTNGLLRQYLPKGSDLSVFTQNELDGIAWTLNTRPRKSLGFKCPAELFTPDAFDFKQHHAALFALGA